MNAAERPQENEFVCTGCGKAMPRSFEYCINCGKKLPVKVPQEETRAIQKEAVSEETWPMLRHDASSTGSDGSSLQAPLEKAWEFQASGDIQSPLAAAYGMVFFGCKDKCVYAVDAVSGEKRWTFKTGGEIAMCPVVADGVVHVASRDKNMYGIEARSGQKKWQFSTGEEIFAPAVAYGMVFFGCKDKNVYALDAATGQKKWEIKSDFKDHSAPTPFEGRVLISGGSFFKKQLFALDAASGAVLWELKDYWSEPCPVVFTDNIALVRAPKGGFNKIDVATGKDLGELASPRPRADTVARSGGFLFLTFGSPLTGLYAWDLSRPTSSFTGWDWAATIEEGTVSAPAADGDFVFVATIGKKKLFGISKRKFMKKWEFELNENVKSAPIVAHGMVFVASEKGKIHAFKSTRDPYAVTTLEYGSYEITSAPRFRVMLCQQEYIWPKCCCLCCGPAEKTTTISKTEGKLVRSMPNLPYCISCYDKTHKLLGREYSGVEISKAFPAVVLAFRNERYFAMFKEANRIR